MSIAHELAGPLSCCQRRCWPSPTAKLERFRAICSSRCIGRRVQNSLNTKIISQRPSRSRAAASGHLIACMGAGDSNGKLKIGFAGLGIMGRGMASNLLKAGCDLVVWNRSSGKTKEMQEAGAAVASTAKELAEQCDIVVAMVADPQAAEELATGPEGIAAGMGKGKGYVDASTIDAATAQRICKAITATGAAYLEAPVSGSKQPAEAGQLVFLCAGDKALFERAHSLFDAMGKASFFLGEVGHGANMKLVVNQLMGSMMASFSEALALGSSAGLSLKDIVEIVGLGSVAAPMYKVKGPSMLEHKFPPAFPLRHQQKDMRLALELAQQHGLDMPVAAAANGLYLKAKDAGRADDDFSAVLTTLMDEQGKQQ